MRRTTAVLALSIAMLMSPGLAHTGTGVDAEPNPGSTIRSIPETNSAPLAGGKADGYAVMVCHGALYRDTAEILCQMLVDSSGGRFTSADTYYIGSGGHGSFPATEWYDQGCRAILAFTEYPPQDTPALGDSLGRFIQLGGGVVEAVFADCTPNQIVGAWRKRYAPFTVSTPSSTPDSLGAIYQPFHPVVLGVSAISVAGFRTGNNNGSLRSPNCMSLAGYTTAGVCLAACFDSAGQRAASLGLYPLAYWQSYASGQWCQLIVNALNWTAVGPSVAVTAPNGGETWHVDSVHNITWTQTDNAVRDSIYYSTNGGSSWTGVAYLAAPPVPPQHTWTVPATPTTRARVKIVAWEEDGGRVEDQCNANFAIVSLGAIEQPENNALPLAFALHRPSPSPSASGVLVRYDLPRPARVELRIYDAAGALVNRLEAATQPAGHRHEYWNGRDDTGRTVAPGVYYCRLKADDDMATQKLVIRR
jgi:hypothetical protein